MQTIMDRLQKDRAQILYDIAAGLHESDLLHPFCGDTNPLTSFVDPSLHGDFARELLTASQAILSAQGPLSTLQSLLGAAPEGVHIQDFDAQVVEEVLQEVEAPDAVPESFPERASSPMEVDSTNRPGPSRSSAGLVPAVDVSEPEEDKETEEPAEEEEDEDTRPPSSPATPSERFPDNSPDGDDGDSEV